MGGEFTYQNGINQNGFDHHTQAAPAPASEARLLKDDSAWRRKKR